MFRVQPEIIFVVSCLTTSLLNVTNFSVRACFDFQLFLKRGRLLMMSLCVKLRLTALGDV